MNSFAHIDRYISSRGVSATSGGRNTSSTKKLFTASPRWRTRRFKRIFAFTRGRRSEICIRQICEPAASCTTKLFRNVSIWRAMCLNLVSLPPASLPHLNCILLSCILDGLSTRRKRTRTPNWRMQKNKKGLTRQASGSRIFGQYILGFCNGSSVCRKNTLVKELLLVCGHFIVWLALSPE